MPSSSTVPRSNLNLPEIKPRQVSSNSSLDSGNSTGASTAASSTIYSQYSNPSVNTPSVSTQGSSLSSSNTNSLSLLNINMEDHIGSLMTDASSSLDPSMNTFTNSNSGQQSSQGTPMPMQPQQAPQTTTLHPSQTNVSSVDYSSNIDSLNFLPLVSSNSAPQTLSSGSNQDTYNTTIMPIVAPQSQHMTTSSTISDEAVAQIVSNTSVPEFLYQLTKMLTDDHREIIEWSNAKIEVHNPHRLESEVLNKYFRHSKYASFQRQLNYFGFRKLAGKGKMAPCSYVNENATTDLRSLLRMKVRGDVHLSTN